MEKIKYRVKLEHVECEFFGRFWRWEIKDMETGEIILKDGTTGDCSEEEAQKMMRKQLYNVRGIQLQPA